MFEIRQIVQIIIENTESYIEPCFFLNRALSVCFKLNLVDNIALAVVVRDCVLVKGRVKIFYHDVYT